MCPLSGLSCQSLGDTLPYFVFGWFVWWLGLKADDPLLLYQMRIVEWDPRALKSNQTWILNINKSWKIQHNMFC